MTLLNGELRKDTSVIDALKMLSKVHVREHNAIKWCPHAFKWSNAKYKFHALFSLVLYMFVCPSLSFSVSVWVYLCLKVLCACQCEPLCLFARVSLVGSSKRNHLKH